MVEVNAGSGAAARMGFGRALVMGAVAGVLASVVMGGYAMVASLVKDTGFFTPLHHIASLWAAPDAMMASMEAGMGGKDWELDAGPALLGLMIHMGTGAVYGALFALLVHRLALSRWLLIGAGVVWGGLVFVFSAYAGLPLAAAIFDAGDPIKNMAEMAGWGTFVIEHLLYGLVLGVLLAFSGRIVRPAP